MLTRTPAHSLVRSRGAMRTHTIANKPLSGFLEPERFWSLERDSLRPLGSPLECETSPAEDTAAGAPGAAPHRSKLPSRSGAVKGAEFPPLPFAAGHAAGGAAGCAAKPGTWSNRAVSEMAVAGRARPRLQESGGVEGEQSGG